MISLTEKEAARLGLGPKQGRIQVKPPCCRVYRGIRYHSAAEAREAYTLDCRQRAGEIRGWERQRRFPLIVQERLIGQYVADFVVLHLDGHHELIEVKGFWTQLAKLKWQLFLALYQTDWEAAGGVITVRQV